MADLFIIRKRILFSCQLTAVLAALAAFASWHFWREIEFDADRNRFLLAATITGALTLGSIGLGLFYLSLSRVRQPSGHMTDPIDNLPWWLIQVVILVLVIGGAAVFIVRQQDRGTSVFTLMNKGDLEMMAERLEEDPALLEQNDPKEKGTLLQVALRENNPAAVAILLDLGAIFEEGDHPLKASLQNTSMLDVLLKGGVDPNQPDEQGIAPLWYAVELEQSDALTLLAEAGADINARNAISRTPLMRAVEERRYAMVDQLLALGADVNAFDQRGDTALHIAVRRRDLKLIDTLLQSGAKPDVFNFNHKTPLHLAAEAGQNDLLERFLEQPGLDVDVRDDGDQTPLDAALLARKYEAAEVLISAGANPDRILLDGNTMLHKTVLNRDYQVARFLIRSGADVRISNAEGETAYDIVRRKQLAGLLELIDARDHPEAVSTNDTAAVTAE